MRQPIFNVKDFGAIGNGVNDDTVHIQNAIAAAGVAGRGTVLFPHGVYLISQATPVGCLTLASNIDCRGVGRDSEIVLAPNQGVNARMMTTQGVANPGNIRILDLHFNGNRFSQHQSYEQQHGVFLSQAQWCQIERCLFRDIVGDAIYLHQGDPAAIHGSSDNFVGQNEFYGVNRIAINFSGASHSTAQGNHIHDCLGIPFKMELGDILQLDGNAFTHNRVHRTAGLSITSYTDVQRQASSILTNISILDNLMEDILGEFAIQVTNASDGVRIAGNRIYRCEQSGIVATVEVASGLTIANNTIREAGYANRLLGPADPHFVDHGAIVVSTMDGAVIDLNDVQNCYIPGVFLNGCQNNEARGRVSRNIIGGSVKSVFSATRAGYPIGLWLRASSHWDVVGNAINQNCGVGVLLSAEGGPCEDNKFRCNELLTNMEGGVWIQYPAGPDNDFGTASSAGNNHLEANGLAVPPPLNGLTFKNEPGNPTLSAEQNFYGLSGATVVDGAVDTANPLTAAPVGC